MSPIESIIYMIWRGVAVGVLISAPMGPVGILCIQRTLDKGRHAGFYTGIGAAISDLFYCLLTGFGLSFIEDFIERNQNVIQLVGSVVLIAFSGYLFRKDPSSPLRRPVPENVSAKKNILGGFLFTFSNPLIMFLIIGLFARFNFTSPEIKGAYYAIGYLFIVIGALGWWYGITYAIEKVRSRFNMRAMKIMNILIGVIILIFACVGMVSSINGLTANKAQAAPTETKYIHLNENYAIDTLTSKAPIVLELTPVSCFQLDFKSRPISAKPKVSRADQELLTLNIVGEDAEGLSDTIGLRLLVTEHSPTPLSSQDALKCDASSSGGFIVSSSKHITQNIDLPAGWCHYRLILSPEQGLSLSAGSTRLSELIHLNPDNQDNTFLWHEIKLHTGNIGVANEIRDIRLTVSEPEPAPCYSLEEASKRLKSSADPMEGIWEIFDWEIDTKKARQGGDYRLMTVRTPDGKYDLLYLEGARIFPAAWASGSLKGRLTPTGSKYVYRLEWIDSEGKMMSGDLRAQANPGLNLLTLHFPFLDTQLRLKKL